MPRELAIFGVLIPTLLPLFLVAMALQAAADWCLGKLGAYRLVWHPSLLRLCVFVCILAALVLPLYQ
ncbi:DUF1656 domain-containing protein [Janthinobacterium fluminis]|uniref:DUF1656 domain-containing protein n=1 Tax=Janthinobacterium fluminis TaxID=2987524 RepID=A0ABT5JXV6_9BURK|nr:DUF1656 domain-containing protein [Janthinobacterium fluminis]MDC8757561.1 DUF1656 domain-containing protein [Janthinobacterium fluminis]